MCYKQEWASAINNLTRAMVRIDRAKKKLEARAHERRLTKARALGKDRTDIAKDADEKLKKNLEGIRQCDQLLDSLKEDRHTVLGLILDYGIAQSEDPAKTRQLMGKCALCITENDLAASTCRSDPYCGVTVVEDCCS